MFLEDFFFSYMNSFELEIFTKMLILNWALKRFYCSPVRNGYSFLICNMNNKADALFLSLYRSSVLRLFSAYLKTHRYYILSFISCIYFCFTYAFQSLFTHICIYYSFWRYIYRDIPSIFLLTLLIQIT